MRTWRQRRRHSQLSLAVEAEISQRHLSFLETGRALPSRDMVVRLAEYLDVPLAARNAILLAAGHAPIYSEHQPGSAGSLHVMAMVEQIVQASHPNPALAIDHRWTMITANNAVDVLTRGVAEHLLEGSVNVLRLGLHPQGLAPRIRNFGAWRDHVLARLARDIDVSADSALMELRRELMSYPGVTDKSGRDQTEGADLIAVPLMLDSEEGVLSFISTTTVFGTATDVTLAGVAIESFYPADPETAAALARLMAG